MNVYEYKMFKYNCYNFLAEDTIIPKKIGTWCMLY